MKVLASLFSIFFRIGLFSIGGGYVMLPMLKEELSSRRKWLTDNEILNFYAIGQATPGIIAVNTATFVGYRKKGIAGALAATAGIVTPSLVIITVIAAFFMEFSSFGFVQKAFAGIRVAVAVLLLFTIAEMIKKGIKDLASLAVFIAAFCAIALFSFSPAAVVAAAAFTGIAGSFMKGKRK